MHINNRVLIMREAITKIVPMLTQRSVKVTQQGTQAFVEYDRRTLAIKRVNLPYIPDDASNELLDATQGFLDHEVGHILFSDQSVIKAAQKAGVATLHNMIEDTFVERKMSEKFPGCGANLTKMHGFFLTEYIDSQLAQSPEHSKAILMVVMLRAWANQPAFVDYMRGKWEIVKDVTDRLGKDFPKMLRDVNSSQDGLKLALEAKKRLEPQKPPVPKAPPKAPEPPPPPSPPEPPSAEEPPEPSEEESGAGTGEGEPNPAEQESTPPNDMPPLGDEPEPEGEEIREPEPEPEPGAEGEPEPEPGLGDEEPGIGEPELPEEEPENEGSAEEPEDEEEEGTGGDPAPSSASAGDEDECEPRDEQGDGMAGGDAAQGASEGEAGGEGEEQDGEGEGSEPASGASASVPGGEPEESTGEQEPGGDPGRDMFKELNDAPVKDFDEAASDAISKNAVAANKNADYSIFTRDEDHVGKLEVPEEFDQSSVTAMQTEVDHMIAPLQKDLQRAISARSAAVWTGGHRRGKLHGASLAGVLTGREDVFRQKQVSKTKDVAVSLVVDGSGSMSRLDKITVAAYTAYALASVLDNIGITNEVLAFSTRDFSTGTSRAMQKEAVEHGLSYSRNAALDIRILKAFNERMTPETRRRFAMLAQGDTLMQENVDGESVQIASHRLQQQRAARKVMMVLSDGKPACGGGLRADLNEHLRSVVKQIEARGTEVVALGILDESVKKFYKHAIVMNSVHDLPTLVMRELHRLLVR
ncbi:MAG: hypothetical protein M3O74_13985 [Pseudomonadota bacterium]|nr:hypothetical protein [Pseudomonadota bacterium]